MINLKGFGKSEMVYEGRSLVAVIAKSSLSASDKLVSNNESFRCELKKANLVFFSKVLLSSPISVASRRHIFHESGLK